MTKVDPVDHNLALVRAATAPPRAAKARVRGALAPLVPTRPALAATARRSAAWKGLGLLGAGLVAGYFLGLQQAGERGAERAPIAASAPLESVAGEPRPQPAAGDASGADVEHPLAEPLERSSVEASSTEPSRIEPTRAAAALRASGHHPAHSQGASGRSGPEAGESVAELLLLSRAERAVRARQGEVALALVTELEQGHPRTRFGEERQALRVLAECLIAEPRAHARADAFLRAHPTSVYSDRVHRLCGPDSEPASGASADGSRDGAH
jgi:hypothetical protein